MSVSATLSSSYRHIFFSSPIPSFSFFIPSKRTQAYFRCSLYTYTYIYSYLNICVGVRPATLLGRRFQYGCFPMKFSKFLRTSFFLQKTSGGCSCLNFLIYIYLLMAAYLRLLVYLSVHLLVYIVGGIFNLLGGLGAGLSFCGVWALF